MKPVHEMNLAEVTLAILKTAVNIPDRLYIHAARLANLELQTYDAEGNLLPAEESKPPKP